MHDELLSILGNDVGDLEDNRVHRALLQIDCYNISYFITAGRSNFENQLRN